MVSCSPCLPSGPTPTAALEPAFPCLSLGLPQALGPHHLPTAGCHGHSSPGKDTEGFSTAWQGQRQNQGSTGQGWLSREGSQLRSGRVGIWTKPHCQFNRMPLTYFLMGDCRGDAHGAHVAPERDLACCPHVPSAGFRYLPRVPSSPPCLKPVIAIQTLLHPWSPL